jgi:hypothetical protein
VAVGKIGKTRRMEAAIAWICAPISRILGATSRNAAKYYPAELPSGTPVRTVDHFPECCNHETGAAKVF